MAELIMDVANTRGIIDWPRRSRLKATGSESGQKTIQAKLVLLGEAGVGKSSIALRFVREEFCANNDATIGAAFFTQTTTLDERKVKFEIWDTAGQERYRCIAPMYYRGAQAAIVVFDVTSEKSYESALTWMRELRERADPNIAITLAANKSDLAGTASEGNVLEIARSYAEENGITFEETSALTGRGIQKMFLDIASQVSHMAGVIGRYKKNPETPDGLQLRRNDGRKIPEVCHC